MALRFVVNQPVVYQGFEHPDLKGVPGRILSEVRGRHLLTVVFHLPDGRERILQVPPESVGVTTDWGVP